MKLLKKETIKRSGAAENILLVAWPCLLSHRLKTRGLQKGRNVFIEIRGLVL